MSKMYVISQNDGKFTWLMAENPRDHSDSVLPLYIVQGTYQGKEVQITTCTSIHSKDLPTEFEQFKNCSFDLGDPKGDAILRTEHEQTNLKFRMEINMTGQEIQADLAKSKGQTPAVEQTLESFKAEVNKIADKLAGKKVDGKKIWHWNGKTKAERIREAADKIVDGVSVAEAYEQMKGALQWQRKFTLFQGLPGQKLKRGTPKNLEALCEKFAGLSPK